MHHDRHEVHTKHHAAPRKKKGPVANINMVTTKNDCTDVTLNRLSCKDADWSTMGTARKAKRINIVSRDVNFLLRYREYSRPMNSGGTISIQDNKDYDYVYYSTFHTRTSTAIEAVLHAMNVVEYETCSDKDAFIKELRRKMSNMDNIELIVGQEMYDRESSLCIDEKR